MRLDYERSAVENRRNYITQQLDRLRSQLVKKSPSHYANEKAYRRQSKRSRELISELEGELLMLDCPGEYDELPAAVVADEMGMTYEQVRSLIKLGEIAAAGKTAHERIARGELERLATMGVPELLRFSRQESAEIFEQAIPHLQSGDLETATRAYRRLDARLSWQGPYAPAFLVGLELAKGDLDGALLSIKLIYECEDPLRQIPIMTYLRRLLRGMKLKENGAQELCDQLIIIADGFFTKYERFENHELKQPKRNNIVKLQQQAMYITVSVINELRRCGSYDGRLIASSSPQILEEEISQRIRNAIYTALYAEFFYDASAVSRLYVDLMRSIIPKSYQPANLLGDLFDKIGEDVGR